MAMWLKKRSRKLSMSPMSPLPPPPVPEMQQQSGDNMYSLSTRRNHKKAKLQEVVATTCQIRSWNEMDYDILVMIMNKLVKSVGWRTLDNNTMYFCKPWLLALLDALFPPGTTLDLHTYDKFPPDSYCNRARGRYFFLLHLALGPFRPQNHYTKVLFGELPADFFPWEYFGSRLPLVRSISFPTTSIDQFFVVGALLPWRNLEEVCCNDTIVKCLAKFCKRIHSLTLFGRISSPTASLIAENFPALKRLVISSCVLSVNALPTILGGQKKLEYLDTSHCFCVDEKHLYKKQVRAKEWKEEIYVKAAKNIKIHLQCARENCPPCSHLYR
ncbi:hypothetical protein H0E87_022123 [Populus deltoides]|uniref:Uncharacterized protein n=1 Tax=Populus deltoides TaxID=3696 RepID=A0A8T2XJ14_POPDE|nr:hypothetical protein H0E87_022123 [Populus deltoides]